MNVSSNVLVILDLKFNRKCQLQHDKSLRCIQQVDDPTVEILRVEPRVKTRKILNGESRNRDVLFWIKAQSSALIARLKCICRASGVGGIVLVNG